MKDAKANYLWADVEGTGSLSLSFEKILKSQTAKYWIATGSFKNLAEFENSNPHYDQFDALKSRNVYTFESKLGSTGGTVYYEVACQSTGLSIKDYIKIFHPELLPNYMFTFAQN
jgi:iron complex transport system substrate-binding protein